MYTYASGGGGGGSGTGDVEGPASSTDNAVARFDSTTGKVIQDSAVTVSDVAAASVTIASVPGASPGTALVIDVPEPAAANGASVAGKALTLTSSDAVASLDTAGAAAGGAVNITAGAAKRNTSGNAAGGSVVLTPGAGIGTGEAGQVLIGVAGTAAAPSLSWAGDPDTGLENRTANRLYVVVGAQEHSYFDTGAYTSVTSAAPKIQMTQAQSRTTPSFRWVNDDDTGMGGAANVFSIIAGGVEIAAAVFAAGGVSSGLNFLRPVAAEVTSPETVAVADTGKVITNEGAAGAVTYNLPTAAAGYQYTFIVQSANDMVVTAATGDTIRLAASVTSAAGTATNGTVGGVLTLVSINNTEWIGIASVGTWTLSA